MYNKDGDKMKLLIGSHVSFKKEEQLLGSVQETLFYGANTFMIYTGAPQNTKRVKIDSLKTKEALNLMKEKGINLNDVIVHAPYLINLANHQKNYDFTISFLKQEIKRCSALGLSKLVVHPGSHLGLGVEEGLKNIIKSLNEVLEPDNKVLILLETMSGKGTECGFTLEQLKKIIRGVNYQNQVGVCLDTCHMHDAGYDLSNFDHILDEFDQILGLSKLGCIHVNDSKNKRGTNKDRHANIGFGLIGFDNLLQVIYNKRVSHLPKILETPYISKTEGEKAKIYPPYKMEIKMIKEKVFNQNLIDDVRSYYKKTK